MFGPGTIGGGTETARKKQIEDLAGYVGTSKL